MISDDLAGSLRDHGLAWRPRSGDVFRVQAEQLRDQQFVISEMTIEAHRYPTGTILGFNGTTEWALDSVAQEDALWLPREDQLRALLGGTFRSLAVEDDGRFTVETQRSGTRRRFTAAGDAANAYGLALLELMEAAGAPARATQDAG